MSKSAGGVRPQLGKLLQAVGQILVWSLCGVGFLWVLAVLWPPVKPVISGVGRQIESLSGATRW